MRVQLQAAKEISEDAAASFIRTGYFHAGKKDELEAFLSGKDVFTLVLTAKGGGASHLVLLHIKI